MPQTEKLSAEKSLRPVTAEILPGSSGQQSEDFSAEDTESLSLVGSSIRLLHGSMKSMLEPEIQNPERKPVIEAYTVSAAVKCAAEIGKLMKVKLEAIKLRREWRNE